MDICQTAQLVRSVNPLPTHTQTHTSIMIHTQKKWVYTNVHKTHTKMQHHLQLQHILHWMFREAATFYLNNKHSFFVPHSILYLPHFLYLPSIDPDLGSSLTLKLLIFMCALYLSNLYLSPSMFSRWEHEVHHVQ